MTLTEKLLENVAPLVTVVSITGELLLNPMSTYTEEEEKNVFVHWLAGINEMERVSELDARGRERERLL